MDAPVGPMGLAVMDERAARAAMNEAADEIVRLRGERDKPLATGRDQVEGLLRFYGSEPYADSSNETVRVRAVLLTTAADEIGRLRSLVGAMSSGSSFADLAKDLPRRSVDPLTGDPNA